MTPGAVEQVRACPVAAGATACAGMALADMVERAAAAGSSDTSSLFRGPVEVLVGWFLWLMGRTNRTARGTARAHWKGSAVGAQTDGRGTVVVTQWVKCCLKCTQWPEPHGRLMMSGHVDVCLLPHA